MQGTSGRSYSQLCFALNNPPEADRWKRPTRPACWGEAESEDQRVKINAIK